ncbi:ligand-binding sensor domain-containing protein [Dyadobacter psychrotolerans]|uniref:Histidine kinase n=1 Tax=Dyadobacter psychrotolerans TaxID=2541721 RepID=A0A4V2Z303_9BACT|nr:two-component regulator propeller domain-containing protein [Dyadobacter psychrotolerans]TDE10848.1 histidine kinase [Dyadobacter psychrotolerans]
MTKLLYVCGLLMLAFCASCGRTKTDLSDDKTRSETIDTVSSYGPKTMVRNVKKGRNGSVLIAASFAGVFRYDGKIFTNLTSKLGSRRFWDVLEDRAGNLWVATTDSGVYYYPKQAKSFQHFTTRQGLASNSVLRIFEDKAGIIWFGTGGGISRYDPQRAVSGRSDGQFFQNFTTKDRLPNNGINTIIEDRSGKLWIGTRGEACFYDGKTFTILRNKDGKAFNNVWGITEDKMGNIWFGAAIIEDKKGDTLVVTAGLWCYDGSGFTKINQRGNSAIIADRKGNLWTTGAVNPNGVGAWKLFRYDQQALSSKMPVATEIMSTEKMLCGILEADDGSIWFGSMNGVYQFDGKTVTDFRNKEDQK